MSRSKESLSDVAATIKRGLQRLHGLSNVKQTKDDIGWLVARDAWLGFRWVHLSYVSGYPTDFIRLRNDIDPATPKRFWPFSPPNIPTFELTFHRSEITPEFVQDFNAFVTFLVDGRDEIYTWELFHDGSFPNYGWSLKADKLRPRKN